MSGRRSGRQRRATVRGSALSCDPASKKPPLSWTRQRRRRRHRCDSVSREVEWRVMVSPMKPPTEVVVAAKEWTQGLESRWWLKRKRLPWEEEVVVRDYPLIRVLFKGIKESGMPLLFLRTPMPYCMHSLFVFHLGLLPSYTPFSYLCTFIWTVCYFRTHPWYLIVPYSHICFGFVWYYYLLSMFHYTPPSQYFLHYQVYWLHHSFVYYSYFRLVSFLPPLLIKTPHLLHATPTNYSCTPIFYFPLLSFLNNLLFYLFIYLFIKKETKYLKIIKITNIEKSKKCSFKVLLCLSGRSRCVTLSSK